MSVFWKRWLRNPPRDLESVRREVQTIAASTPTPLVWLFGKTGSGKTSIIRYLTNADDAEIGLGFRPQTRTMRRYDFPSSEEPLISFLDTRGLGEAYYDPADDIAVCSRQSQLVVVTVRATDHALDPILGPLLSIRETNPGRPILLVVTCLHQAAPQHQFQSSEDPFHKQPATPELSTLEGSKLPEPLRILLEEKVKQFRGLYDVLIPVDLTQPEDGLPDPSFGGDRLKFAIIESLPQAFRQSLIALESSTANKSSSRQLKSKRQVLASSAFAASAGAVPVPWVDIPAVLAIQTHMAYRIAEIYDQEITAANWAILSSAVGSNIAIKLLLRGTLKLIPFVGMAAGAMSSFAFTYALGMSWDWYFASVRNGRVPSVEQLRQVFRDQLSLGRKLWGVNNP